MPTGIPNIGCSCYLNAVAQALSVCPDLQNKLKGNLFFDAIFERDMERAMQIWCSVSNDAPFTMGDSAEVLTIMLPDSCNVNSTCTYECQTCGNGKVVFDQHKILMLTAYDYMFFNCDICKSCEVFKNKEIAITESDTLIISGTDTVVAPDYNVKSMIAYSNRHYYAFVQQDDRWYRCDDERVYECAPALDKIVLMFYVRQ